MTITSILSQPSDSVSYSVSYRPIRSSVQASALVATEQPAYADIYISGVFYKTMTAYSIANSGGGSPKSIFAFDVQDALQEYLKTYLPALGITTILQTNASSPYSMVTAQVKFRGSSYSGGVLVPEATIPIQGTATTAPVSGGGLAGNTIHVLNGSLLPTYETPYDNLPNIIWSLLKISYVGMNVSTNIFPLSNLPHNGYDNGIDTRINNTALCPSVYSNDYGGFPIVIQRFGTSGMLSTTSRHCKVMFRSMPNGNASIFWPPVQLVASTLIGLGTYYLPCGLADIQSLVTSVFFEEITDPQYNMYYRIELYDVDANQVCFFSPMFKVQTGGFENMQLMFQNMYGHFESVSFARNREECSVTSGEQNIPYYQPVNNAPDALMLGRKRYSVRAADEIQMTGVFPEALLPWLKELFMSPYVLMPYLPISGSTSLRAVEVKDASYVTKKTVSENRTIYEVTVKVRPAIDYIPLRN